MPVALRIGPANRHDSTRLMDLVESARRTAGATGQRVRSVHADKGYDTVMTRTYLNARGISDCIPHRRIGKRAEGTGVRDTVRYVVERFFSWLKSGFRRLQVRYERNSENYLAFANIASFMMYFRVLG